MSSIVRHPELPFRAPDWHADVMQMLDEHHLVASSDFPRRRVQFAADLTQYLGTIRDVELCVFYGDTIADLDSFCTQLERALPGPTLARRLDGPGGVASLLRWRAGYSGRSASKYRYYIWHDADALLRRNRALFGRLVDTLIGVAAEAEYASDDLLLLHRTVFVGGSPLKTYAQDASGQFVSWFDDDAGEPFWEIVTGIARPPVRSFGIDSLVE